MMIDDRDTLLPANAHQAKEWLAALGVQLAEQGILFRDPPDEPTTCCGRGCSGCVWEGYFGAVGYWCEQARQALLEQSRAS